LSFLFFNWQLKDFSGFARFPILWGITCWAISCSALMAGSFCTTWQVKWKNSRLKEVSSVVYTLVYNVMSGRKINKTAQRIEFPRDEVILFLAGELHMYIVGANFQDPAYNPHPIDFRS